MTITATRPAIAEPVLWEFPAFDSWAAEPGLRGQHLALSGSRMLHLAVWIPTPLSTEPREQEGVTNLCARLLVEGTRQRTGQEFAAELDRNAASLRTSVSIDGITIALDVPVTRAAAGIALLGEALTAPAFPAHEVERLTREILSDLRAEKIDGGRRAATAFHAHRYLDSDRRARRLEGDEQTLARIDRQAVLDRYRQAFVAERAQVLSVGSLSTSEVRGMVVDALQEWRSTTSENASVDLPPPQPAPARTVLIDKPGATQTAIEIGWCTPPTTDPSWPALRIGARVLGEGLRSRLNLVLREQKGYTYGVHAITNADRRAATFRIAGTVASAVTGAALTDALGILLGFRSEGLTDEEHRAAATSIISSTPISHETGRHLREAALAGVRTGRPVTWLTSFLADLGATSAHGVSEDFRRSVAGEPTIVLVGDASVCIPLLADVGIPIDSVVR